jgi:hypothetical protein
MIIILERSGSCLRYVEMRIIDQQLKITNNELGERLIRDDFTPQEKAKNLTMIGSLLDEIRVAKEVFCLEDKETSLRREVGAALTDAWVTLDKLRPESLRNYGDLNKGDEALLKEVYERFENILNDSLQE